MPCAGGLQSDIGHLGRFEGEFIRNLNFEIRQNRPPTQDCNLEVSRQRARPIGMNQSSRFKLGDGYAPALTNFKFIANAVVSTGEAASAFRTAKAE